MMRSLVIGGSGFIGRHIMERCAPDTVIGTYHRHAFPGGLPFDTRTEGIVDLLARLPSGVTHAFVLHGTIDTEACARDPVGTAEVNVESVWRLLVGLLDAGIVPVYVSTDYVFDGTRGMWQETDQATPSTQYGKQKLEVENRLLADPRPAQVVRLSRVVGTELGIHSVLGPWVEEIRAGKTMRCAIDQVFSPAGVDDIAGALLKLAASGATGLYHLGGPKPFSRIELLRLLSDHVRAVAPTISANIVPCSLHDLPFSEKRPLDTSIAIDKVQKVIDWQFAPMAALCAELARREFGPTAG
jgi:dTDP-4-dehydrorhamnose reductase